MSSDLQFPSILHHHLKMVISVFRIYHWVLLSIIYRNGEGMSQPKSSSDHPFYLTASGWSNQYLLRHIILGDTCVGDSVCDWVIILYSQDKHYSKTKIFRRQRYAIQRYAKDKSIYERTREKWLFYYSTLYCLIKRWKDITIIMKGSVF